MERSFELISLVTIVPFGGRLKEDSNPHWASYLLLNAPFAHSVDDFILDLF